jgi:hypothetical protein
MDQTCGQGRAIQEMKSETKAEDVNKTGSDHLRSAFENARRRIVIIRSVLFVLLLAGALSNLPRGHDRT